MPIVYLISGANRGLGLGFVQTLLSQPDSDAVVFAGARNPVSAVELHALSRAYPEQLHVVKLTAGDEEDNSAAVQTVRRVAGRLDVVIANAGIGKTFKTVYETPTSAFREHWDVNVAGAHTLFQSTLPLLLSSARELTAETPPKFVVISSTAGSTEIATKFAGIGAYGASKAAVNWLCRKIHFEHESDGLVCFLMNPGVVDTDMLRGHNDPALENFPKLSPTESATKLLALIDTATRENLSGKLVDVSGTLLPW